MYYALQAVLKDDADKLIWMLEHDLVDLAATDDLGNTAAHLAVFHDSPRSVPMHGRLSQPPLPTYIYVVDADCVYSSMSTLPGRVASVVASSPSREVPDELHPFGLSLSLLVSRQVLLKSSWNNPPSVHP